MEKYILEYLRGCDLDGSHAPAVQAAFPRPASEAAAMLTVKRLSINCPCCMSSCAGCDSTRGLCAIEKGLKKRLTFITIAHPVFRYETRLPPKNNRFPVYRLVDKERIAPPCSVDNFNSLFYPHFADRLPTRSSSHLPTALGGLRKPRPVLASTNSTRICLIPVEAEAAQVACFDVGDFPRWSGFGQAAFLPSVCAGCMPLVLLAISWCGF